MAVSVPDDLQEFLRGRKRLRYDSGACEPGQIELLPLSKLEIDSIWINARPTADPKGDPHAGEDGYYDIPAINLVAEAEGYDPEFILLWLPDEGMYGTWDNDHAELFVFPKVTWTDIVADPLPYVAAQWEGGDPGVPFVPYPKYPFHDGRPF
jgi:hypothetical protein